MAKTSGDGGGNLARRAAASNAGALRDGVAVALAATKLLVQLSALTAYGWFRDELYYVACSDRLAWGYVDHPPFSIALLRVLRAVAGDSLVAIRLVPALAGAALVFLTARTARAAGGGSIAALVAGGAVLLAPGFFGFDHYYSMNALDHLFWMIAARISVHLAGAPDDRRAWIGLGATLGLGLTNKWSVAWVAAGLAIGLSATPARRALRTPWPYAGVAIAAAIVAPHLAWEVTNGWPTLEFMRNALAHKYVAMSLPAFLRETFLLANPVCGIVAIAGVVRPPPRARPLAIAFAVTLVVVASSGSGKPEYMLGAFPLAFASGGVVVERLVEEHRARRIALVVVGGAAFGLAAIALPFGVPVLSEERFIGYAAKLGIRPASTEKKALGELPQFYADMHGWPELVDEVARIHASLSDEERRHAKIWARTGGYGPAAAIDVLGRDRGLPRAIAAHNAYFTWGWGDADRSVTIVMGGERARLEALFEELELRTTFRCRLCMPYEDEKPIWVGRRLRRPWSELWPELKHYE